MTCASYQIPVYNFHCDGDNELGIELYFFGNPLMVFVRFFKQFITKKYLKFKFENTWSYPIYLKVSSNQHMSQGIGLRISVYLILRSCSEFIFNKLKSHKNLIKLPKNKVLTLYQKARICEMSLTPGFNKEKCEKEF